MKSIAVYLLSIIFVCYLLTPEDFEDGTPLVPVDTDDLPF